MVRKAVREKEGEKVLEGGEREVEERKNGRDY